MCLAGGNLDSYRRWHRDVQREPFCMQEVILSDAEDAIELLSFTLFGGSPEDAAMRDFRPPGCRRSSKQVKAGPFDGLPDLHGVSTYIQRTGPLATLCSFFYVFPSPCHRTTFPLGFRVELVLLTVAKWLCRVRQSVSWQHWRSAAS